MKSPNQAQPAMVVKFFIPGEPVAQGRPRATTINGRTRMYDAPKSATYKNMVSMVASLNMILYECCSRS